MLGDLSLTPFILLAQVAAWVWIVRRARLASGISDEVERDAVALACLLLIWAAGLSSAALAGLLRLPAVAGLAPVLWLGLVPYALVGLSLLVLPTLRIQSLRLLDRTPAWALPLLQALRLSALASLWPLYAQLGGQGLWQAMTTEPLPFALAGLDLLFGVSALPVAFLVAKQRMGPRAQVAWLVLGSLFLLVPRLGPMDQSLGLAFSYFYLPLDPQGLLGYPQVLNYGLIGPGFVLAALWQGLWLLRRDLARRTRPLGAVVEPRTAGLMAGVRGGLTGGLARMTGPLQAMGQRRQELAVQRASQRAERKQAKRLARAQNAQAAADKKAARAQAKAKTTAKSEAKAGSADAFSPSLPPSLPPSSPPGSPPNSLSSAPHEPGDGEPPALVASNVPPLAPQDISSKHGGHASGLTNEPPETGRTNKAKKRPWFLGGGKAKAKIAPSESHPAPDTSGAQQSETPDPQAAPATHFDASGANFGAPPLPGHEDLDFDTSPFQIEPLPERAWSKAHDLNAEPDIPFADPLLPTNVAPLPSDVPPPAPPPLDPIFQSVQSGVRQADEAEPQTGFGDADPTGRRDDR